MPVIAPAAGASVLVTAARAAVAALSEVETLSVDRGLKPYL
jgi:hypothetical protein